MIVFILWRCFSDLNPWLWKGGRDLCILLCGGRGHQSDLFSLVIQRLNGERQLHQKESSAARVASWVSVSRFCFGPHELSMYDLSVSSPLSHRYIKEKQSYGNNVKFTQRDKIPEQ